MKNLLFLSITIILILMFHAASAQVLIIKKSGQKLHSMDIKGFLDPALRKELEEFKFFTKKVKWAQATRIHKGTAGFVSPDEPVENDHEETRIPGPFNARDVDSMWHMKNPHFALDDKIEKKVWSEGIYLFDYGNKTFYMFELMMSNEAYQKLISTGTLETVLFKKTLEWIDSHVIYVK